MLGGSAGFYAGIPGKGGVVGGDPGDSKGAGAAGVDGTVEHLPIPTIAILPIVDSSVTSTQTRSPEFSFNLLIAPLLALPYLPSNRTDMTNILQTDLANVIRGEVLYDEGDSSNKKNLVMGDDQEIYILDKSSALFAPTKQAIKVQTKHGVFEIQPGSIVLIESNDKVSFLQTLHDHKAGDVRFVSGNQSIEVNVGHQLVVAGNSSELQTFNKESRIATRGAKSDALSDGSMAQVSEFSMTSAILNHQVLRSLRQSTDRSDNKHFQQIAKNACALFTVTMHKGPYGK